MTTRTETAYDPTRVRTLESVDTRVFLGGYGLLHCKVADVELYRGVFAVLLFPVSHPDKFVSLRYTDEEDKIQEIGVIEDLNTWPEDERALIHATLNKHYHLQTIHRIHNARCDYGWLLTFDVETDRGREEFLMRWRQDRAEAYGNEGKILLDIFENVYVVPDVNKLPAADRRRFRSVIYW